MPIDERDEPEGLGPGHRLVAEEVELRGLELQETFAVDGWPGREVNL
jgi:hypothetical protein